MTRGTNGIGGGGVRIGGDSDGRGLCGGRTERQFKGLAPVCSDQLLNLGAGLRIGVPLENIIT